MHDDLLERDFTAETVNTTWLTDITEHPTAEGKLYLCAIKDCASNRILGYSLDAQRAPGLPLPRFGTRSRSADLRPRSCTPIGAVRANSIGRRNTS